MNRMLIVLAVMLFVVPALAADWTVDKSKSELGFTATQTGAKFTGHFTQYDAGIQFDPAHPEQGHAVITIDMASAVTGDKQRDQAIPGADWFSVKAFPMARFEAKTFRSTGKDTYEAAGTLTIRGISKDVTLPFTLKTANGIATVDGTLPLTRTDYGVGQGEWASGKWVGLDVTVTVHMVATGK